MEKINNKGHFEGGYFILNPNNQNTNWEGKDDLFVTLPYETSIKGHILKLIRNAKSSIKICSFILTDEEIFDELQNVLSKSIVSVFIITQLDNSKFSTSLLSEEEMTNNYYQNHLDIIKKLYSQGAHVRASQTAHAKFIVFDRKQAMIMSANLTTPSLINNPETGVILSDSETNKSLDRLFDVIFQFGTEYTKFISAGINKQFIVSRENQIEKSFLEELNLSNLRFTYEDLNQSLYQEIINVIACATSDIYISTYSIVGLEHLGEFISVIKMKIYEGYKISIFCRGMNYRADHLKSCAELAKLGCIIYGDLYNHSKGIITAYESLIFTANIDGYHGLKNGFEVGLKLDENQSNQLAAFIKWQIASSPYIYKLRPSKKEYFECYSFYYKQKGIKPIQLPKDLNIVLSNQNMNLYNQFNNLPCHLKVKQGKITQLQIGNSSYKAWQNEAGLNIGEKIIKPEYNLESYLLQFDSLTINTN